MQAVKRHGCHNRAPFAQRAIPIADGFYTDGHTRTPRLVPLPFRMSKECQFGKEQGRTDPGCEGCKWRETEAAADSAAPTSKEES